ncbi:unnamed protein product [Citrullus colocynthis]|uniref:Uncharacterized protein n=1 Tax=Citrullus colocynthis TaxID=252529 RepID=A0ABP0Y3R4_9ROSI
MENEKAEKAACLKLQNVQAMFPLGFGTGFHFFDFDFDFDFDFGTNISDRPGLPIVLPFLFLMSQRFS